MCEMGVLQEIEKGIGEGQAVMNGRMQIFEIMGVILRWD